MPILDTYMWEDEVLGERSEFPGHPLIIAVRVMDRYASHGHAKARRPGSEYGQAISDGFILGAGCAVSSAMDVLKLSLENGAEAGIQEAGRYWLGWEKQSPNNKDRAARGRAQAERVQPMFLERLSGWQTGQLPPTKCRVSQDTPTSAT